MDEYTKLDATALAERVRRGDVKPEELLEMATLAIERVNPQINAVITRMDEQARRQIARGLPEGPFTGVPFLLKDLLATYGGVRYTGGSRMLADYVSPRDSELVARYKKAGFVIIGKTNTPEFGLVPTTEPALFGPCRNPWSLDRTTGGSSGGSAAAVAAGLVPAAHANDGGGSIRIPASCCGLFGLKPTRGRNPLGPDHGEVMHGLVVEHVVTRSVRDSAAILDATQGPDLGAPYYAPPPEEPFASVIRRAPQPLRIACTLAAPTGAPVHDECVEAVKEAVRLLEGLGHRVEEENIDIDPGPLVQSFMTIWATSTAWEIEHLRGLTGRAIQREDFEPLTWALYEAGKSQQAVPYLLCLQEAQRIVREMSRRLAPYDLWLTPTLAEPPVPLGTLDSPETNPMQGLMRAAGFSPFTPVANLTGQPAMSVPLHWSQEGLPIGVHFVGRYGDEATLLRLAAQLEQARPWCEKRPPVHAG